MTTRHSHNQLPQNDANFQALSPISFLRKAAEIYPDICAIDYGTVQRNWAQTYMRCRKLASALSALGAERGDVVTVMAHNTPELYEAHFAVPMAGLVLNALNTRLDARTIAYILDHAETRILITDREFSPVVKEAMALAKTAPIVIDIADPLAPGEHLGTQDYEAFLAQGDESFAGVTPQDEWDTIAINYTSGTTGNPKGVVYHHRGAYLNAVGNTLEWDMAQHPTYLWTLPMFHCNGWCFPWTIAAKAGTNVCLRKVSAENIYNAIAESGVTHMCGAPIVMSFITDATKAERRDFDQQVKFMTAAAPPPAATLQAMAEQGIDVTHVYGLTEVYGPAVACAWNRDWAALPGDQQAEKKSRQGHAYVVEEDATVMDAQMQALPADGESLGEVMLRGNIVMKGYLKNDAATAEAFAGGWFHSGDLGVRHGDGYIQLKDRAKDIIISGGENISSIEIEDALYKHPAIAAVGVVAKPDAKWGETPCAFVELKPDQTASAEELIAHVRGLVAGYKVPRSVVFEELPKTSTGKIQKGPLRERAKAL